MIFLRKRWNEFQRSIKRRIKYNIDILIGDIRVIIYDNFQKPCIRVKVDSINSAIYAVDVYNARPVLS
jgi:hypothetical protein